MQARYSVHISCRSFREAHLGPPGGMRKIPPPMRKILSSPWRRRNVTELYHQHQSVRLWQSREAPQLRTSDIPSSPAKATPKRRRGGVYQAGGRGFRGRCEIWTEIWTENSGIWLECVITYGPYTACFRQALIRYRPQMELVARYACTTIMEGRACMMK